MAKASHIVLGTMRMAERSMGPAEWAPFFQAAHRLGIRSLHSSHEYESFGLLCETLALLRRDAPAVAFRHVVKLAAPSFNDDGFSANALRGQIEEYRAALGTDIVHDIQWMWRHSLSDEPLRLNLAKAAMAAISEASLLLKDQGLIERFFCFPYTTGFADLVLDEDMGDGLIVYRNLAEREFDGQLDRCAERGKTAIIIRPFHAGALVEQGALDARELLTQALDHRAIESAILSTSSLPHLEQLID
jgi:aryl-alcohol dehydrogenase-like predicted oxidoreductase